MLCSLCGGFAAAAIVPRIGDGALHPDGQGRTRAFEQVGGLAVRLGAEPVGQDFDPDRIAVLDRVVRPVAELKIDRCDAHRGECAPKRAGRANRSRRRGHESVRLKRLSVGNVMAVQGGLFLSVSVDPQIMVS